MDWRNRGVSRAVRRWLRGRRAAGNRPRRRPARREARLRQRGARRRSWSKAWAAATANFGRLYGETNWIFEGPEIFKRAVLGMSGACADVLAAQGYKADDVDLVVPHQANLRIIEAVAKRAGVPMERVFVNVHRYGNMSAATVPVALVEAIEEGRVKPGSLLLLPAFGAGLTWCAHLVRWGERMTPQGHVRRRTAAVRPDGARDRAGLPASRSPEPRRSATCTGALPLTMAPARKALLQIHFCVVHLGLHRHPRQADHAAGVRARVVAHVPRGRGDGASAGVLARRCAA